MTRRRPVKKKRSVISAGGLVGALGFIIFIIALRGGFKLFKEVARQRLQDAPDVSTKGADGGKIAADRSAANAKWIDVYSPGGWYAVIAPSQGQVTGSEDSLVAGRMSSRKWMWSDRAALEVSITNLSRAEAVASKAESLLEADGQALLQLGNDGEIAYISIEDFPGIEVRYRDAAGTAIWTRIYMVDSRRFQLIVGCAPAVMGDPRIREFMDSFEIDMDQPALRQARQRSPIVRPKPWHKGVPPKRK